MVQISVEINCRYNLPLSSTGDIHHAGPLLFHVVRYVKEWYQALRSIGISQFVGTSDDEQHIGFGRVHYKHVNMDLFVFRPIWSAALG